MSIKVRLIDRLSLLKDLCQEGLNKAALVDSNAVDSFENLKQAIDEFIQILEESNDVSVR